MRRSLAPVVVVLLCAMAALAACGRSEPVEVILDGPWGDRPPISRPDEAPVDENPEAPADPAVDSCVGPSFIQGCSVDAENDIIGGMPASTAAPAGALDPACDVDAWLEAQRPVCGDVVDVEVGEELDDALAACPADALCRLRLPPGTRRIENRRVLHCAFFRGDDTGTSVLETDGGAEWIRAGAHNVAINASDNTAVRVRSHALFVGVNVTSGYAGIDVGTSGGGDVRICGSVVLGGYSGIGIGGYSASVQGVLVDHSAVAGCYQGFDVSGDATDVALTSSVVQGGYSAVDADTDLIIRDSQVFGAFEAFSAGAGSCADDSCGVPALPGCGERAVDFGLAPGARFEPADAPAPTAVTCEPRLVVELAGAVYADALADIGVSAGADDVAWCVDTVRFLPSFEEQWWWRTDGEDGGVAASAFPEPCDGALCGTLLLPDGSERPQACLLTAVCDGGSNGYPYATLRPGSAIRDADLRD